MIVKCNINKCSYPPLVLPYLSTEEADIDDVVVSKDCYTIDSKIDGYCITKGRDYIVYGILFYKDQIRYLICNDNNMPGFFPSILFRITEPYVWFDWEVNEYTIESEKMMIMGYSAITETYEDLRDLIDNKADAVDKFLDYKYKEQNWHSRSKPRTE